MSFDAFWSAYPRRVSKFDAKKAYDKAAKLATEGEIMLGAQRYAAATSSTEMQFIKHPATWLRHGCWEDDMIAIAPRRASIPLRGTAALAEDLKQEITNAGLGRPEGSDHQAGEQLRLERFQLH